MNSILVRTGPLLLAASVSVLGGIAGLASAAERAASSPPSTRIQLPEKLPAHPRLLFDAAEVARIKERLATQAWAKKRFAALKAQADRWLQTAITLPDRGGQWYHWYSCPKHGARLRTDGPTRHVCPIDREVFSGYPYDEVVITGEHDRFADGLRVLGIVYQLTREKPYAAKARDILLAYAERYETYPLHNIRGEARVGGGKVGPQTLDESTWLIDVVEGADCVWDTLSNEDRDQVVNKLLRPATEVIRQHKMGIHNIQCWKNSAVGLTGLLIGDLQLVEEALHAESGYFNQMAKGVSADGPWYENAWGYHFYTVSAVLHLTEGALHSGLNLYGTELKRMFDAPLAMCMPNFELPAFNDSGTVNVLAQAAHYETAYARYLDTNFATVLRRVGRDSEAALLRGAMTLPPEAARTIASHNFSASGNAILAAGSGTNATWLCLDYGPHGGGHGHPDKLSFVLYGRGQVIAPDPGTANYGVPIQSGWYRTSLAHNTLTVDEQSQRGADGQCDVFFSAPGFAAVMARAGKIYDGIGFRRTCALLGEELLVFIDQVAADKEHTFDLAYHNVGTVSVPAGASPIVLPDRPGYAYLRQAQSVTSSNRLSVEFTVGRGHHTRWALAGGDDSTCVVATGVGRHTEDRVPMVVARRKSTTTTFVWALWLGASGQTFEIERAALTRADDATRPREAAGARVRLNGQVHLVIANPAAEPLRVGHHSVESRLAWLRAEAGGTWNLVHAAR